MRWAALAVLLLAAALIQVALGTRFEVWGAFPNLVLLAVVTAAWTAGPRVGMASACAGGVLLDLASAGPVGPHALALLPGAYAVGLLARRLEPPHLLVVELSAAVTTVAYSGVLLLTGDLLRVTVVSSGVAARLALAASIYNTLLAVPVFGLVRSLGTISRRAQA
jgi:rod shape-determining protein MreD